MTTNLKKTGLLLAILIIISSCCCPSGEPEGIITNEEASQMKQLFLEHQGVYMNEGLAMNFPEPGLDNNFVSFDLQDLKKYIHKVETIAKEEGFENVKLQINFAAKLDANLVPKSTLYFRTIGDTINPPESVTNPIMVYAAPPYNMGDSGNGNNP